MMEVTLFEVADKFDFQEYKYNEDSYQNQAPCIKIQVTAAKYRMDLHWKKKCIQ